jgi:thermitase
MKLPRLISLVLFTALLVCPSPGRSAENIAQDIERRAQAWETSLTGLDYVPDEVIVEFADARSMCSIDAATLEGFRIGEIFQYRPVAVFKLTSGERMARALARLETSPGIRRVGPNIIRHCDFTPNDALYNRQENLIPTRTPQAWEVSIGSASVTVAVIDTGLDVEHPEFAGRVVYKENFYDGGVIGQNNVFDDSGHGTGVTGVITAQGNNSIGIAGMAWDVRIMAFRACGGGSLQCSIADEVQAIDSAVAHGAQVINLSLGGEGTNDLETQAVQDAHNAGVVMVAAAGNNNPGKLYVGTGNLAQDKLHLYYPAAFPEVIGVAALDNQGGSVTDPSLLFRAAFSNYGEDIVSVAAVGTAIETTVPYRPIGEVPYAIYSTPNYARLTGTSFSTPQVSGLACLVLSVFPDSGPAEVEALIEHNARPMGGPDTDANGVDDNLGYGLIDAAATLGTGSVANAIHENGDFLVGVTPSPLYDNEVYVLVRCKRGSDGPPSVSYFIATTGDNAAVQMEALPAQPDTYLGRFFTLAQGNATIQVSGLLSGQPLQSLSFKYEIL